MNRRSLFTDPSIFSSASLFPLLHKSLTIHTEIVKYPLRLHFFLVVYVKLWNKISISIWSKQNYSCGKAAPNAYLGVTQIPQLTDTHISEERAFKSAIDFKSPQ